ncbi:trigger factor [Candidatus Saccharibacteria bacterium]|nr:trigger factor [Candidatus Saccharibacteria bacterium]
MKVKSKKLSDTRVEIKVTLEKEDLEKAREKAVARLSREVKLEGFRKGKAPKELAEKALNPNDVNAETIDIAVRTTVPSAFEQAEKSPLVIPNVNVTKYVPGESAEYTATADILPEVKLGNYKDLKAKKEENKVSKSEIDEVVSNIQKAYAEKKTEKKKAEKGDEVIIDFVGKKDGEPFRGGSAKDYPLTLGSNSFIPGFEDGIVRKESGDKFDLPLTFPKDYGEKSLAGEKVVFEILVKQVNKITLPELNDDFAKKCGPFKNMDELRTDIEKNLKLQNEHKILEKYKDDLVEEFVKNSTVSAPEILISDQLNLIKNDMERNAMSAGMKFEDYLKANGMTDKEWEKKSKEVAEKRVKASLVLQILARDEKISVSEDEVLAKIAELRDVYKKSPEALKNLKDPRVKMDIKNRMTIEKTLDFLVSTNEKSEKPEKTEKK